MTSSRFERRGRALSTSLRGGVDSRGVRLLLLSLVVLGATASATEYRVGPGQVLGSLGQVPWESLGPGDLVLIYARPAPYAEKFTVTRSGRVDARIVVRGVPDPTSGALPIITGLEATTRPGLVIDYENEGVVVLGGGNRVDYLTFESLHFRHAREAQNFYSQNGSYRPYLYGAGINAIGVSNFVVRKCIFEDFDVGLRVGPNASDVLIERNVFRANGNAGPSSNLDLGALRARVQFNDFGAPTAAADNVRDASAGAVYAYNLFRAGSRMIDFLASSHFAAPEYQATTVVGNLFVKDATGLLDPIVKVETNAAQRELRLVYNSFIARRAQVQIVQVADTAPGLRLGVLNNLMTRTQGLTFCDGPAAITHGGNWGTNGLVGTTTPSVTSFTALAPDLFGPDAGLVDGAGEDFRPTAGSPLVNASIQLPAGWEAPTFEYRHQAASVPRDGGGALDIGAFEYGSPLMPIEPVEDAGIIVERPDGGDGGFVERPDGGDGGFVGASDGGDGGADDAGLEGSSTDAATPDAGRLDAGTAGGRATGLGGWSLGCTGTGAPVGLLPLVLIAGWLGRRLRR